MLTRACAAVAVRMVGERVHFTVHSIHSMCDAPACCLAVIRFFTPMEVQTSHECADMSWSGNLMNRTCYVCTYSRPI